ncbi:LPS assembly lipoprotein LptE [Methylotenera versatilis]|uniref:LPS-assembly lipoprotein LptE n=1 Tax=Methylotenera versatilis TaxID=1055487 RepID=UPI000B221DBA|nr:LPS assembly lipoprotein LptE [Methylotenera versatilis]
MNLSSLNAFNTSAFKTLRMLFCLCLLTSLVACGFQLRGSASMAFSSIFIQGSSLTISKNLLKSLKTNDIKVLSSSENADLLLDLMGEEREKRILSLSGRGLVNEFELFYRVHYRTKKAGAELWSPVQTIEARRDFSYSDANLLAKQGEEKRLNENMQADVLSNLIRRLSALKK